MVSGLQFWIGMKKKKSWGTLILKQSSSIEPGTSGGSRSSAQNEKLRVLFLLQNTPTLE